MNDSTEMPQFAVDLNNAIDYIVTLDRDNYEENMKQLTNSIDKDIISAKLAFQIMGRFAAYRTKDLQLYAQFLIDLGHHYKIKIMNAFIYSKKLENILIKEGIVNGILSEIEEFEIDSIQNILIQDDVEELIKYCNSTDDFDFNKQIVASHNYLHYEMFSLIDSAAFFGAENCFKYLYENKAKLSVSTFKCAITGGNNFIISFLEPLLSNSIDSSCLELSILTHTNYTSDYLIEKYNLDYSYRSALATGNIEFFFKKFNKMGSNPNTNDHTRINALQAAVFFDFSSIAEFLIEKGGDIELQDNMGNTPLMITVFNSCESCAKVLLNQKNIKLERMDSFSRTALFLSCLSDREEITRILLDHGAEVSVQDGYNNYPICVSAERGNANIIKMLLDKRADIESRDRYKNTPLILATKNLRFDAVKILLENGADVNAKNMNGMTPLHYAARFGENGNEIFDLLMQYNADPFAMTNSKETPIKFAMKENNDHIKGVLGNFKSKQTQ